MKNILTVDVEDWFHILEVNSSPDLTRWDKLESRVEKNFFNMLELFDEYDVKTTCFFLGWIVEKHPQLVLEASKRGHEVASHGYAHRLVYTQTRNEFYEDIYKSKKLIEDVCGEEVISYRCPGFSITEDTPWAFEEIVRAGYKCDSSIFPASRGHGGLSGANIYPHVISTELGDLIEFPITISNVLGKEFCFFGGGYLRLFPSNLIKKMSQKVNAEDRPVVFYIHPREIDPSHPRLEMNALRKFKSYVNLKTTYPKLKMILSEFKLVTMSRYIAENFPTTFAEKPELL